MSETDGKARYSLDKLCDAIIADDAVPCVRITFLNPYGA